MHKSFKIRKWDIHLNYVSNNKNSQLWAALPVCMFVYSAPKCLHWNPYTGPRSPSSLSVNPSLSRKAREPLASQIFTPFADSSLAFVDPCDDTKL